MVAAQSPHASGSGRPIPEAICSKIRWNRLPNRSSANTQPNDSSSIHVQFYPWVHDPTPRPETRRPPTDWRPGHRVRPAVQFSGPGQKEVVGLIPVLVKKCLPAQTVAAPRF